MSDVPGSVLARLQSVRLSPRQRLISEFVLENLDDVVLMSSSSIATGSGVSQASVSRFCRALDFDDFGAFQQWLHDQRLSAEPHADTAPFGNHFQRVVQADQAGLGVLADWLDDPSDLVAAAEHLASSECLPIIGTRVSASSAVQAAYFARRVHRDVRLITTSDSAAKDELTQARMAGATAALVVWLPRFSDEVASFLRFCASRLELYIITDPSADPPLPVRSAVLPVQLPRVAVFDQHATVTAMVGSLIEAMCRVDPQGTAQRLAQLDG